MRRLSWYLLSLVCFLPSMLWGAVKFPSYSGFINDYAGVLSPEAKREMSLAASWLEEKSGAQIAVAILPQIYPYDIETYAVKLFEQWGVGQKGKDNGVLILVALRERRVRIEVGYGLEGAIPDVLAKEIIEQNILPYFRQGDFSQGLLAGFIEVVKLVAREYSLDFSSQKISSTPLPLSSVKHKPSALRLIFALLFFLLFMGRGFFFPFFFFPLGGGFWSEGEGGFGGGFGSFGGFGGGLSGGGGASGGW